MRPKILFSPSAPIWAAALFSLFPRVDCYQFWEEANYLSNFDALESASYSAVNDPSVVPSELLSTCRQNDNNITLFDESAINEIILEADGVDPSDPNVLTVSAASAQSRCGDTSSICVIPRGLRLIMNDSLNVNALKIQGELYWRDQDQTTDNQYLCGGYVAVEGPTGKFIMSTNKKSWIYIKNNGYTHPSGRTRFFGGVGDTSGKVYSFNNVGPTVEITGKPLVRSWSLLAEPFLAGHSSLKLLHSPVRMGWKPGDRIGVAPTTKGSDGTGKCFLFALFERAAFHY